MLADYQRQHAGSMSRQVIDRKVHAGGNPMRSCLQVTPVFQEILELDDTTMEWLRVGFSTATSVCGLLSARPLLQAHLHSAMVQWWTHRNAGRSLQVFTLKHGWCCMDCSLKGLACLTECLWAPLPSTPW